MLADLDVGPQLVLRGLAGLIGDGADGTHHAAAGTVDLGNAQLDLLLDHLGQVSAAGLAALGSGNEHPHALDGNHDTALVLFGDNAFENRLLFHGLLDILPDLHGIQALLAQLSIALDVVDTDDVGLDLIADLHHVLGLDAGIIAQLAELDVRSLLGTHIHLDLGGGDGRDNTGDLLSCI